jgi:endoglucanase
VQAAQSPVDKHGQLSIVEGRVLDQHLQPVSLAGPSLFWSTNRMEGEAFYTARTVRQVKQNWKASIIRAAMSAQGEGSYLTHPEDNQAKVERVVDAAVAEGLYVIIDWHSHQAEDNLEQAEQFFSAMARKYGHLPNVIYEIYNEPLRDTDWSTVIKPYSEAVIASIRKIDPDNLILVGSQSWSQYVDVAAADPIVGFDNLAYTLHFYAGTHKQDLRDRAQVALDAGLALFVSEWGTVNANGDGGVDRESTELWLAFMRKHSLSHCSWSIVNKKEGAAILQPGTPSDRDWVDSDLTPNGHYLKKIISEWTVPNADR